jgi:hypothetical protein
MVEEAIQKIAGLGRIRLYELGGVRYGVFPKWKDHQHPKFPTPSKLPALPALNERLLQGSPSLTPGLPHERRVVESSRAKLSREETIGEGIQRGEPTTRSLRSSEINGLIDQLNQLYADLGMDSSDYKPTREVLWNQYVGAEIDEEHADPIKVKALLVRLQATASRRSPLSVNGGATR